MANELNIGLAISGLEVYTIPFLAGVAQSPILLPEIGTYGIYRGDMAGVAGEYDIIFTVIANSVETTCGMGRISWDGTAEITEVLSIAAALPDSTTIASAVRTELSPELARIDVPVSDALAAVDYIAPDNAGIAAIPTTPLLAADYVAPDNVGITSALDNTIFLKKTVVQSRKIEKVGPSWFGTIYDTDGVTPLFPPKHLTDKDGNEITDLHAGIMANELAG